MNTREFLNAVIIANIADDVTAFATAELNKLDAKNTKRRNTLTKAQAANADIKVSIVNGFTAGLVLTAAEVATANGISTQKASALLRQLVADGVLTATEVKNDKKAKVKGYSLPTIEGDEDGDDSPDSPDSSSIEDIDENQADSD